MRSRVLSGMRPTGPLHLGHYLGVLKNWVALQERHECFFMVADWHALMSEYAKPQSIPQYTHEMVRDWLSCGIDPTRSTIFIQSQVPQHLELAMAFALVTPLSWLERNPTYKEQLRELEGRELATYGFLGYPVLQIADIALYRATVVPVGEDQLPHLELGREIIRRFNATFQATLPEPQAQLTESPRLLGSDRRKMSKSFGNTIDLADAPETIRKKVQTMITDPARIKRTDPGHPEVCNVFSYYKAFAEAKTVTACRDWCENAKKGCTECKAGLAEILVDELAEVQKRRREITDAQLDRLFAAGHDRAIAEAETTMREVRRCLHLGPMASSRPN